MQPSQSSPKKKSSQVSAKSTPIKTITAPNPTGKQTPTKITTSGDIGKTSPSKLGKKSPAKISLSTTPKKK